MFKALLRLTKQSAIYGIGHIITKAVVIVLLPIHTNFVSRHDYGVATQLLVFLGIMGIIYSSGLNTALLQFYLLEDERKKRKAYFTTALLATLLAGLVLSGTSFLFRKVIARELFDSVQYDYLIKLGIGILTFDALVLLAKNILRAEDRAVGYVGISFANVVINLFFNVIFVAKLSMGVKGIFLANLIASASSFVLLLPVIVKNLIPGVSWAILHRMLKFGLPFLPATLAIFFMDNIDRLFIKHYLGMEATGIYGAGYKLALVIKLFINAFQIAWIPFFLSLAKQEPAKEVYAKVLTYFALVCGLIFLAFTMFMEEIVRFNIAGYTIFGKDFLPGTQIVPVVILAYICYGFYLNFLAGIYLKEKTKYLVIITATGAFVNIVGNFLLIPAFNLMGAAYATLVAYAWMAAFLYVIGQKYYPVKYELGKILKLALLTFAIFFVFKNVELSANFLFKMLLLILYFVLLCFFRFFDSREISRIKQMMKRRLFD